MRLQATRLRRQRASNSALSTDRAKDTYAMRQNAGLRDIRAARFSKLIHLLYSRAYAIASAVLIVGIGIFLFSTLRAGLDWDGDSALYIMDARNIVEGQPYAATDFIANPRNPINPAAYPPGLPLLLAPVYFVSGVNLEQMKCASVIAFLLFLAVFARIARDFLPPPLALAAIPAIGLHPYIWQLKDSIFSELPFLLFCYSALLLLDRLARPDHRKGAALVIAAAVAVALAYLTRSIGIVLFPVALFASLLYRPRRLINPVTIALLLGAALAVAVQTVFPNDLRTYTGYFESFKFRELGNGLLAYAPAVHAFIGGKILFHSEPRTHLLVFALAVLVLSGFVRRVASRWSIYEIFCIAYGTFLLLYPIKLEPERYSLPLWPLFILFAFVGARALWNFVSDKWQYALPVALCATLAMLYGMRFSREDFGPIKPSVTGAESTALFNAVKTEVPPASAVLVGKPTVVALFTGRRAAIWPARFTDDELWAYVHSVGIDYIIEGAARLDRDDEAADPEADLHAFVGRNQRFLKVIFANKLFSVYQISGEPTASAG